MYIKFCSHAFTFVDAIDNLCPLFHISELGFHIYI